MSKEDKNKIEIVFAPGCFDDFEGSQEELQDLIQRIKDMAETGELFENSEPLDIEDLIDEANPLEIEEIVNEMIKPRTLQ